MISPSPAQSRSNAFPILVIILSVVKVWARTQHAPSFGVIRTSVRLHLRNQPMYLPAVSFRVLPSYVLWAYFIIDYQKTGGDNIIEDDEKKAIRKLLHANIDVHSRRLIA